MSNENCMEQNIMVSIWCITYNHEKYIRTAIDNFLTQRTDFEYEIVIHDDASTDGTVDILKEYEKQYPEKIHVFYEASNLYSQGKLNEVCEDICSNYCRGKYIAICEGDDYWIDNNKLQIQVDYMESHPNCVLTAHNGLWVDANTHNISVANGFDEEKDLRVEDIIRHKRGCFPTASMVLLREMSILERPFNECSIGDWPTQLYCVSKGNVHYFDRIMSVYNCNHDGSWTHDIKNNVDKEVLHALEMIHYMAKIDDYFEKKYSFDIGKTMDGYFTSTTKLLREKQDLEQYLKKINVQTDGKYSCEILELKKRCLSFEKSKECLLKFIENYEYIVVMGCGQYASDLYELLKENNVEFEGFVVSNNQKAEILFKGKCVWKLSDIPFDKNNLGVVVGIQQNLWNEIIDALQSNGIKNYYWPTF